MEKAPSILLVEDTQSLATTYASYLAPLGHVRVSHTAKSAKDAIAEQIPDLIVLDLNLPDEPGQEVLSWIKTNFKSDVIIVTAHGSIDIAMDLVRLGAKDFLEKPVTADRLRTTAANCLENRNLNLTVDTIKHVLPRDHYHGFIGACLPIQAVYKTIDAAAPSNATVLITGESGTGKEVCAQAIKQQSPRKDKPFIAINCGAIPGELIESELFGHIKGAFTGANAERKGAILEAHKGTLFLDEIGEMPLDLQTKLLRFLQNSEIQKVGSNKVEKVDVRVICATNRDPLKEVDKGRFREDLYYRLNVLPIDLPPLRERGLDINLIANDFLLKFSEEENKRFKRFSAGVEHVFLQYPWPGNIRQLQNVVRNIVVLHNGETVEVEHLPPPLNDKRWLATSPEANSINASFAPDPSLRNTWEPQANNARTNAGFNAGKQDANSNIDAQATVLSPPGAAVTSHYGDSPVPVNSLQRLPGISSDDPNKILTLAEVERRTIERAIVMTGGNIPKAAAILDVSPSTIYRKKQHWEQPHR